jgi:transcriptional regulator with XRE-family HTH domain
MNRDGVNASDVARAVHMTHVGVGHYLRGNRIPGAVELYRIAKYFGVPMEYFLEGEAAAREMVRRATSLSATVAEQSKMPDRERAVLFNNLVQKVSTLERAAEELRTTLAQTARGQGKKSPVSSASAAAATRLLKSASASGAGRAQGSSRSPGAAAPSARTSAPSRAAGKRSKR